MQSQRAFLMVSLLLLLLVPPVNAEPAFSPALSTDQRLASANQVLLPFVSYQWLCTAPVLLAPANNAQLDTLKPRFTYITSTTIDGGVTTTIATDAALTEVVATYHSGPGSTGFTIFSNLEPATDYFWRVEITCGEIDFVSPVWHFRTGSGGVILPAPALLAPEDGIIVSGPALDLSWTAVPGAAGYWVRVHWVGHYATLCARSEAQLHLSSVAPDSEYRWRVEAYNDYAYGETSPERHFTTGSFAAAEVDLPAGQTSSGGLRLGR